MKNLIAGVILIIVVMSCQSNPNQQKVEPTMVEPTVRSPFIHTVFFYFNDEATEQDKSDFEKGIQSLKGCPTVSNCRIGKAAMTPRDIVDNTYDFALIIEFADMAAQNAYQTDPIHLKFIDDYQHLWKEVKVYDSIMTL